MHKFDHLFGANFDKLVVESKGYATGPDLMARYGSIKPEHNLFTLLSFTKPFFFSFLATPKSAPAIEL
jgi:hypothetical protein